LIRYKTALCSVSKEGAIASASVERRLGATMFANYAFRAGTLPHVKQTSDNQVCYAGLRNASGRLPKSGWLHCSQLSPLHVHVEPYRASVIACLEDIVLRREALPLTVTRAPLGLRQ
jgi:hypothetical protein